MVISEFLGIKVMTRKYMAPWHAFTQHTRVSTEKRRYTDTVSGSREQRAKSSPSSGSAGALEGGWVHGMKGAESSWSKGASAAAPVRKESEDSHYRPFG